MISFRPTLTPFSLIKYFSVQFIWSKIYVHAILRNATTHCFREFAICSVGRISFWVIKRLDENQLVTNCNWLVIELQYFLELNFLNSVKKLVYRNEGDICCDYSNFFGWCWGKDFLNIGDWVSVCKELSRPVEEVEGIARSVAQSV